LIDCWRIILTGIRPTGCLVKGGYVRLSEISGTGWDVFFTVNLLERRLDLLVRHIDHLREAVRVTKQMRLLPINAWVALLDPVHCIWTLPEGDADYATC
jgi:REP element-mobilizing transposase RayT